MARFWAAPAGTCGWARSAELSGMKTEDPYHLQRFVAAQDSGGTYDQAAAELRAGRKTSHWMWFIFPQIAGLGYSPASRMYAITSLDEARAYLAHPVLGARLIECATILTALASSKDVIAYIRDAGLYPRPAICGKMNHIQWLVLRPARSSAAA